MITSKQIEQKFRAELQDLLDKYQAIMEAEDHYKGYAECGEDIRITVDIATLYDDDGNIIREGAEIDLGSYQRHGENL